MNWAVPYVCSSLFCSKLDFYILAPTFVLGKEVIDDQMSPVEKLKEDPAMSKE